MENIIFISVNMNEPEEDRNRQKGTADGHKGEDSRNIKKAQLVGRM